MILIHTARKGIKMVLDYPQYPNGMYRLGKNDFDDIARAILKEYMPGVVVYILVFLNIFLRFYLCIIF